MKKKIIQISILMIIFCVNLFAQLQMKMSTNKDDYEYGETIHIYCSVTNISDTTFNVISSSWESCDAQFRFNDYYSGEWTACLATLKKVSFPPHTTKNFKWTIEPKVFGLPNKDGEQRIIGDYSYGVGDIWDYTYDEIRDTIYIQAPEYLGGQVSVKFSAAKDSLVTLLKDSLEVEVLENKIFENFYYEKWQVTGYNIDSLANFLNDDARINSVWLERSIQYDSVYVTSTKNYYPLSVGNKWVYYGSGAIRLWASGEYWWEGYGYDISKQIVDTIRVNDTLYYKMEESVSNYGSFDKPFVYLERYDSTDCYVYLREVYEDYNGTTYSDNEYPNFCLCTEIGDTVSLVTKIPIIYFEDNLTFVHSADSISEQFGLTTEKRFFKTPDNFANYTLAKGFGLTKYITDGAASKSDTYLKGCVIDGIVYGDTSLIVSVEDEENNLPKEFTLSPNYPNPFNPSTKIKFSIPNVRDAYYASPTNTLLSVYDILGREIKTLLNKPMQPGSYEVEFDGSNLPSGVYFYRLTSNEFSQTRKMLLIK